MLQAAKSGYGDPHAITDAIIAHLVQFKATYGVEHWRPKHHYAMHLGEQVAQFGTLLDCFVVERSHQLPKLMSVLVDCTRPFERSVIARTVLASLRGLKDFDERDRLTGKASDCPQLAATIGCASVTVASSGSSGGVAIASGDIAFADGCCVQAIGVGNCDLGMFVLGHHLELITRKSPSSTVRRLKPGLYLMWVSGMRVHAAHAWSKQSSGDLLVLEPHT